MDSQILVWDRIVRLGHWLLAISFAVAYISAESERWRIVHVVSGCVVFATVVMRIVWGFIGSRHAIFSSFIKAPIHAWRYLESLAEKQPTHSTGHNPAGGWAVLGLLSLSLLASITGWMAYNNIGGSKLGEWHELVANSAVLLIALHVIAVIVSSYLHRENLVLAMLTGLKRGNLNEGIQRQKWITTSLYFLLLACITYTVYSLA